MKTHFWPNDTTGPDLHGLKINWNRRTPYGVHFKLRRQLEKIGERLCRGNLSPSRKARLEARLSEVVERLRPFELEMILSKE